MAALLRLRPLQGVGPASGAYRLACYETLLPEQWSLLSRRFIKGDFPSAVMANVDPVTHPIVYDVASVRLTTRVEIVDRELLRRERRADYPRSSFALAQRPRGPLWPGLRADEAVNRDALPRAYFVGSYEVRSSEETLDQLAYNGSFDFQKGVQKSWVCAT